MVSFKTTFWLVMIVFFVGACGPDTIFLRPALDTPDQHVKNGYALLKSGKIEAAEMEFTRARDIDDDLPAHVGLALVRGYRGDIDGGLAMLEQVRSRVDSPDDTRCVERGIAQLKAMRADTEK